MIETWNEVCQIILLYWVMCFSDFVDNPETRLLIGYLYIGTMSMQTAPSLLLLLWNTTSSISNRCCKKRFVKAKRWSRVKIFCLCNWDEAREAK